MKLESLDFQFKDFFIEIFNDNIYLVGGTIRDFLIYKEIGVNRDIDLLVVGHSYRQIEEKLKPFGKTNTVGKSFAVVKFSKDGRCFDISVPRKDFIRDRASYSHKNFVIEFGPHISLEDDLQRRDFTCNSIALRLIDGKVVDPFDGIRAIEKKKIFMTYPDTFFDDPLRILRCARFASVHRFGIEEKIYKNAKGVTLSELSKERVVEELFRLFLESERPSIGLQAYFELTILEKLFPPLYALTLTIQDAVFHPETDQFGHHTVWAHTVYAVDVAKKLSEIYNLSGEETLALLLATLLHDVGKAVATRWEWKRGRMTVTSQLHDSQGEKIADEMLTNLGIETRNQFPLRRVVLNLIRNHHRLFDLYRNRDEIGFRAVSRLVKDLEGYDFLLLLLDFADRMSREPEYLDFDGIDELSQWWLDRKEEWNINNDTIQPLIMGRDLIDLGVPPGVEMGQKLQQMYDLQLDGAFDTREAGLELFKQLRKENKI